VWDWLASLDLSQDAAVLAYPAIRIHIMGLLENRLPQNSMGYYHFPIFFPFHWGYWGMDSAAVLR
jgi:hypothetical protein